MQRNGTAVIVLAAGGSTRLGSPKQLLVYRGKTLLRRAAQTALATGCYPVAVVLGAQAARCRRRLEGLDVLPPENEAWERGMGGSIRKGMGALDWHCIHDGEPVPEGVLLTLCDQPFIGPEALSQILAHAESGRIVAAAYGGTVGVPAWFSREYFDELRNLPKEAGAKLLLKRHAANVLTVDLPQAAVDIDTREQYEQLTSSHPG